jgi:hypothetical protein
MRADLSRRFILNNDGTGKLSSRVRVIEVFEIAE